MENEKGFSPLDSGTDKNETIRELASRHLNNEEHTTSDEEIRNAKIEEDATVPDMQGDLHEVDNTTIIPPLPGETDDDSRDDEDDDNYKGRVPNPYDVLG